MSNHLNNKYLNYHYYKNQSGSFRIWMKYFNKTDMAWDKIKKKNKKKH